jgi:hypothetical protein
LRGVILSTTTNNLSVYCTENKTHWNMAANTTTTTTTAASAVIGRKNIKND